MTSPRDLWRAGLRLLRRSREQQAVVRRGILRLEPDALAEPSGAAETRDELLENLYINRGLREAAEEMLREHLPAAQAEAFFDAFRAYDDSRLLRLSAGEAARRRQEAHWRLQLAQQLAHRRLGIVRRGP